MLDRGDNIPSDLDDLPPNSPTAEYSEVDYDPSPVGPKSFTVKTRRNFIPQHDLTKKEEVEREAFAGIVIDPGTCHDDGVFPRFMTVLRSDGTLGNAHCTDITKYELFTIGDSVDVIRGAAPGEWLVTGHPRKMEDQYIALRQDTQNHVIMAQRKIKLRIVEDHSPMKTMGIKPVRFAERQEFVHHKREHVRYFSPGQDGCVRINFGGTFKLGEYIDTDDHVWGHKVSVATKCESVNDVEEKNNIVTRVITFEKQVGFKTYYNPVTCKAHVALKGHIVDSVLNQRDLTGFPVFTDCPRIGGEPTICTERGRFLKIGDQLDDSSLWIGRGDKPGILKLIFPNSPPPRCGMVLSAVGMTDDCVKLGWLSYENLDKAPLWGSSPGTTYYFQSYNSYECGAVVCWEEPCTGTGPCD